MKWFKHLSSARDDERIAELEDIAGLEGYAMYFKLLEIVAASMDQTDRCAVTYSLTRWASLTNCHPIKARTLVGKVGSCGLVDARFEGDRIEVAIPKLLKHRDNHTKHLQVACKQEVEVDREVDKKQKKQPLLSGKPDGGQGRKAQIKREALEYLDFLNAKAGKHFRPVLSNLRFIEARLTEGVTLQDLKTLTVRKCREWLGTDQEKYLRPETLCNPTKCHSYLGAIPKEEPWSAPNAAVNIEPKSDPASVAGEPRKPLLKASGTGCTDAAPGLEFPGGDAAFPVH